MSSADRLKSSRLDAQTFLRVLGGAMTFQTFDDTPSKRGALSRVLYGDLSIRSAQLAQLNQKGAGVFVMVNEGDGKGRKSENVTRVRACFADLDGAPLQPVLDCRLRPHIVIETSAGKYHAYWLCNDLPLADFKPMQHAIAQRFGADRSVNDLARVMRLPGFLHNKREPFRTFIFQQHDGPRYSHSELVAEFRSSMDIEPVRVKRRPLSEIIPEGERNNTLFSLARGLVQKGYDAQAINHRLQQINAKRCNPPMCASEVDSITANASAYGSDGFAMLPHVLLDSPDWRTLPPATQAIIVFAYRRYNGNNNGNIALTWIDFAGREGFSQNIRSTDIASAPCKRTSLLRRRWGATRKPAENLTCSPSHQNGFRRLRQCQEMHPAPVSKTMTPI
ncbi:hypothetical protein ELE36_09760 [Pseudolysobacter antarcticus]|uniref:Primase C-terminal 1 domain-containing protein n=1 Tax=Pseudolysobacter antarcticus TaxID=2511995 RepID=A0A411HJB3_9GAMM|nr:DNA-primase RepB domain-containing protein [Pseudolysobacter antarcticus]QBB70629.1 hypothetical protein ELE36_09760 [Pseudolysobacter antarcticus]